MMRTCKTCGQEKELERFVKGKGDLRRYWCKDCKNASRRTGRPNTGKFQPGHDKGKRFEKGHTPWYKVKGVPPPSKGKGTSESKNSAKLYMWKRAVKERDGHKCMQCASTHRVAAHHVVPWRLDEIKRFDISNGITLCISCHGKAEGFQKGMIPHNKKDL